jgi:hypothetical protein
MLRQEPRAGDCVCAGMTPAQQQRGWRAVGSSWSYNSLVAFWWWVVVVKVVVGSCGKR